MGAAQTAPRKEVKTMKNKIREKRQERGMTLRELAKACKVC